MPQISVIVPVYKVEPYIRRCVDSILAQTFTDFELILVDDGSPDNCPAICDEYTQRDSRVRVIHQVNQGVSVARNCAVSEALGSWINFVDSDDVIHPQMLESLYQSVIESGADISMCGAVNGTELPDTFGDPVTPAFDVSVVDESYHISLSQKQYRYWVVWGKLIRKQIVEKIPFTPGRIYEDSAVVCKWLGEARLATDTETPLYFYQINPNSIMMTTSLEKRMDNLWAMNEIARFYESVHYEKMLQRGLSGYLISCAQLYHEAKSKNHDAQTADMIRLKMKQYMKDNSLHIKLSREERDSVRSVFHPHIAKVCRFSRAVFITIRHGGMSAVFKKAKAKVSKKASSGT